MSGWSDPQKGGRAVGAALYPTLSALLSTAPKPGMRAAASDAPGSMLFEIGGKWGGSLGSVSQATLDALTAGDLAQLADGVTAKADGVSVALKAFAFGATASPAYLGRQIKLASLGDSTDYVYVPPASEVPGGNVCDLRALPATISGSANLTEIVSASVAAILSVDHGYTYVGDGGIPGQTSTAVLARGAGAYSSERKSIRDVLATNPDVVIMNGPTINAIQTLPEGSDHTTIDSEMARLEIILSQLQACPKVIVCGMYGFDNTGFTTARNEMIREMIVYSWGKLRAVCAKFPNATAVIPDGVVSNGGVWIDGMCGDSGPAYVHLSTKGGVAMAKTIHSVVSRFFKGASVGIELSDYPYAFANAVAGVPANCAVNTYGSGSAITSKTIVDGKLRVTFNSAGVNSGILLRLNTIQAIISGLTSGASIQMTSKVERVGGGEFVYSPGIYLYENTNTYRRASTYPEYKCADYVNHSTRKLKLDRAGSAIGTSSFAQLIVFPESAGTYTVDFYPPRLLSVVADT